MRNFLRALAAVLSAFVGIRKSGGENSGLRPGHYIAAGVLTAAALVGLLLLAVNLAVGAQ